MKTKEYYMSLKYPILLSEIADDGEQIFVAEIKELPGLKVYGDTYEEVLNDIEEAKEIWLETNIDLGRKIKEPIENEQNVSGRVTLRMSKTLHRRVKILSDLDDVSINSKLNELILNGIANEEVAELKKCIENNHTEVVRRLNKYDYEYEAVVKTRNLNNTERGGIWSKRAEDLSILGRI